MAFSINTNEQALSALRDLNSTNTRLAEIQTRINTGLDVAGAEDNAAVFAIAQRLRADVAGLNAVQGSLDNAISALDVGLAAAEATSDLLIELQERAVSAADVGLDTASRESLNDDFGQLRDQIASIVNTAEFNGINIVNGDDDIQAITDPTGSSANTITITAADLSLGGSIITIGATASIETAANAATQVTNLETSLDNVNEVLSRFGAGSARLQLQSNFTTSLSDTIEVGIGNLVDADLAEASADLQAVQVQQQLGLQALSIANQAPGAVLSLFG